ncbi:IS4 family transposase [Paenibacillus arenilitoris]|uniref:IS4 family transposase n=1 Tax=Paenibacillus arenilitoris TaxID=2772299 RepID=A0A927CNW3_9BACL|nr:IS4 family transposase [Paenibacillus arenilitoris]MBD2870840.1 IS4 family transposase [Paenibacillus arenilitoris]
MNEYANSLKQTLTSLIRDMSAAPAPYVKNPETDFTRKKKLPFETVMQLLISMGGNSIYKELLESQGYDVNTATTSAFVQQRNKILPSAVEFLFHEFTKSYTDLKDYRGYRLLAVDGSDLHIATDATDTETYFQSQPNTKGYNLLHLNAAYDLCNRLYVDAIVQPRRLCNEGRALAAMVDRSPIKGKTIVTADRGYESYNNFAHIERKGWNFVIRVKDLDSNGILSGLRLPAGGEFDIDVRLTLTKKQTKEVKAHPEIYRFVPSTSTFDFLDLRENLFYPISFRVVRLVLPNGAYETVITNLSAVDFPPAEIRSIYNLRWGIETSFRALKYTVGLTNFHAKKQESIIQEIFAKMIMYNFAEMITSHVVISQMDKRHPYQVNFTVAVYVCRQFLRSRENEPPPDVEALIRKNILPIRPVRPGQKNTRKIRYKSAVSFVYRVA